MAVYREDIVDIELQSGSIHRSFMNHAIGLGDEKANRFGVRLFRNGEPVNVGTTAVINGLFMNPGGTNILISETGYPGSTGVSNNTAWVQLPASCYAVEGKFCLAIKIISGGVTGTMRIVDGVVDNTGAAGAVVPSGQVPTSEEIIAAYEEAVAVISGAVRFDGSQNLSAAEKKTAVTNIGAANTGMVAPDFDETQVYRAGQYVIYDNQLYRLIKDHAANTTWANTYKSAISTGKSLDNAESGVSRSEVAEHERETYDKENANNRAYISQNKGELISTEASGAVNNWGTPTIATGLVHAVAPVVKGKRYLITGTTFSGGFPSYLLMKNNAVVFSAKVDVLSNSNEKVFVDREIEINEDADEIWVNGYTGFTYVYALEETWNAELITIGDMAAGVVSKNLNTVTADNFIHITAAVKQWQQVVIAGITFTNHDFPSYILTKNGAVVSYASLSDASEDTYFDNYTLTIEDDADSIIVNCYAGHPAYIKSIYQQGYSNELGYIQNGVLSNGLANIDDGSTFRHIVAPVENGKTYRIAGITFANTDFPSYILLKNGAVVSTVRLSSPTSDEYFRNNNITISSDVDTIVINGTTGGLLYIKEVVRNVVGYAAPVIKEYVKQNATVAEGVHQRSVSGIVSGVGSHSKLVVSPGQKLKIHAYQWQNTNFVTYMFIRNNTDFVYGPPLQQYPSDRWVDVEVEVPYDANYVIANGYSTDNPAVIYAYEQADTKEYIDNAVAPVSELSETNYWKGKKIVWFGTSIPAAGANPGDTVGNGSYPVRIGEKLGATVYNEAVGSSCVRFGNYQYATEGDPQGFAGQWLDNFLYSLSGSTEEKQEVFDNWDYWKDIIQSGGASGTTLTPEQIARALSCCYDVKLDRYLTGGDVGPVDLYVFDHGHNEEYRGDYSHIKDIPPEGHEMDRSYFIGAMRFLINRILEDNPKAQIVFIGHYENDRKTGVSEAQETLHNIWKYPLIRTWDYIGWSQNTVTINGETKTITQIWMPDDLHPSSDTTGEALKHYAEVLYPFMRDVR